VKITETYLKGCFIIQPEVHADKRGAFFESYHKKKLETALGFPVDFVQDNQSVSKKNTLRGLHFQEGHHAQAKLARVAKGEVLDVVVDLRDGSPTFGQYFKIRLSEENNSSIFIPKGMAHGFLSLSEEVVFIYKCDNYYHAASEKGIIYNDPTLKIDWEYPLENIVVSEKDAALPTFKELFS
jgi:dTDP-4-dehydrorhamnose 3,5-epimerase